MSMTSCVLVSTQHSLSAKGQVWGQSHRRWEKGALLADKDLIILNLNLPKVCPWMIASSQSPCSRFSPYSSRLKAMRVDFERHCVSEAEIAFASSEFPILNTEHVLIT